MVRRTLRLWSNAERKWLAQCLTRAELGPPSPEYRFGSVQDSEAVFQDLLSGNFGSRTRAAVDAQIRKIRDDFAGYVDAVPEDIKKANDSRLLVQWIVENCNPYSDGKEVAVMGEGEEGEGAEDPGKEKEKEGWQHIRDLWQQDTDQESCFERLPRLHLLYRKLQQVISEVEGDIRETQQEIFQARTTWSAASTAINSWEKKKKKKKKDTGSPSAPSPATKKVDDDKDEDEDVPVITINPFRLGK